MREAWYYIIALLIMIVPLTIMHLYTHSERSCLREFLVFFVFLAMFSIHASGYLLGVVHVKQSQHDLDEEKALMNLQADSMDVHKFKPPIATHHRDEPAYQQI